MNNTIGTPAAERAEAAVSNRFPNHVKSFGQYNRRKIAGSSTWSEHSWANGVDIMVKGATLASMKAYGDPIFAWLNANRTALGIRVLLWQVKDHYDHIHMDFWARGHGTPPTSLTGVGQFKKSNGSVVSARIQSAPHQGNFPFEDGAEEIDVKEVFARMQASLIRAGYDLGNYKAYLPAGDPDSLPGADGVWGVKARAAQDAANKASSGGVSSAQAATIAKGVVNGAKVVA